MAFEDIEDFKKKLLMKLKSEAINNIKFIREGIKKTLGDVHFMSKIVNC